MKIFVEIILPILADILLVLIVAFFAASETAFLSITRVTLHQMIKKDGDKKNTPAKKIQFLKKDTNRLLSLILIGINFVTSLASGLAAMIAIKIAGNSGSTYATIIISFVLIVFGEIMPKTVAAVYPVQMASIFASPLIFLEKLLFPIVWLFSKITDFITEILTSFIHEGRELITEDELKSLIAVGANEGTLENSEKRMLYKIFEFTDLKVHDIMRHKSQVQFVPENASYVEIADIFAKTGYSRLPVCRGSFEDVLGVLYYKNVLLAGRVIKESKNLAARCMRPALFIPETITATELLQKFRKENINFAVAVDENGSNIGIVTMDDIMRAVFGHSVHGEQSDIPPETLIVPVTSKEFLVPGDMKIDDVNELLKLELVSDDYDTLAGWLLEQFDAIPEAGETIRRDGVLFKVEDQTRHRIQSVRITFP
ncbi:MULTISPECIES: hemolysin family protein [unclassified Treponema]|uniref:hemolysin family protein n=1 Tax=unclassified Treponema TaxID=2638727 RepID=UPI0025E2C2C7|nr:MULTISPECIES: hemolysin family protein [unclassified Treponema]